jgi:FlaA1/EpsC-like NDP-sugar epimerase
LGNLGGSVLLAMTAFVLSGASFPRSIYLIDLMVCFLFFCGLRLFLQVSQEVLYRNTRGKKAKSVLVWGTGWAAASLVREMRSNPELGYHILGVLDEQEDTKGEMRMDVKVLGTGRALKEVVERFRRRGVELEEVLIAMPQATATEMRAAIELCREAGVTPKTLPSLNQLLTQQSLTSQVRDISVEDLLFRKPVSLNDERVRETLAGKCVLVTGAAGSIGSELCRQIAVFGPKKLVLLDQGESPLFEIDLELNGRFPLVNRVAEIADIRDEPRLAEVIRTHRVETIFHAAAYKHVPLMEAHVLEAMTNNVLGTWNLAQIAYLAGVRDFVMISSDKAVNPTNVMGATKRAAELIVCALAHRTAQNRRPAPNAVHPERARQTKFVSVRFGNVLASNGSVVPIFQRQLAAGGPITVTHPEVRRYFMTIAEAVNLVLQASTMGRESEIFVLDMGQPVRIADLARNMIMLAGLVPDKDIEIVYTGLRPGEKLYEELITEGENILPTHHEKIKIFRGEPEPYEKMERWIDELRTRVAERDAPGAVEHLKGLIPEYEVSEKWQQEIAARAQRLTETR